MADKMITPKKKSKKTTPTNARIFFILDRSGSMTSIKDETIGGFNAFLAGQKEVPGKVTVSLVQFDHEYLVVHDNVPLESVPDLDRNSFVPRGYTALYDAVGRTINSFKDDNPEDTKTIVAILTDGQENASKEYNYAGVKQLISQVEADHGWEVLFLGTNMDAGVVGTMMGIKASNSVTFDYTKTGTIDAMASVNFATSSMRGAAFNYADGTNSAVAGVDMSKLYSDVKSKKVSPDVTSKK
jgi:hypothetical protein